MHVNRRWDGPRTQRTSTGERGFTLIELLVVITILGILAAVVVFAVQGIGDKGKASAVSADAAALRTAEETNCAQHSGYEDLAGLKANGLLASTKAINSIALGSGGSCGSGPKSSFSVYDANAATDFVPGKSAIPVGSVPTDVAINPVTNMIYVVNTSADDDNDTAPGTVSVIDGATDTVVGAPIPIGTGGAQDRIAVNPHDNKIYVANVDLSHVPSQGSNDISIIDANNADAVTTRSFSFTSGGASQTPVRMLADPKTDDVYVMGTGSGSSQIMIIDGAGNRSWVDLDPNTPAGSGTAVTSSPTDTGFALNPTTDTIYAQMSDPALVAIDGGTHAPTLIPLPLTAVGGCCARISGVFAVDPATNRIYTTGTGDRINAGNHNVPAQTYNGWWTMATDGATRATTVVFKDTASRVTSVTQDGGIVVNPNTSQVYVLGKNATGVVRRFDPATDAFTGQVVSDGNPNNDYVAERTFAVNPNTNRVYMAPQYIAGQTAPYTGGLVAFDGSALQPQTLAVASRGFAAIAINPQTNKIYATDPAGNSVAVLK